MCATTLSQSGNFTVKIIFKEKSIPNTLTTSNLTTTASETTIRTSTQTLNAMTPITNSEPLNDLISAATEEN